MGPTIFSSMETTIKELNLRSRVFLKFRGKGLNVANLITRVEPFVSISINTLTQQRSTSHSLLKIGFETRLRIGLSEQRSLAEQTTVLA